ncbi:MAG: phosphoribosyltransferase [Parcubacteria group bacterium]|nr:phosphoribosyltransferase [Parcubacteria group bacterium]
MALFIDKITYLDTIEQFVKKLEILHKEKQFHAIVAPKRSGLFVGVWASHALALPLFTHSEINSIPEQFKNILVVDAAICTGKTMKKIRNKLKDKNIFTAVVWQERDGECDFALKKTNDKLIKFFYEIR